MEGYRFAESAASRQRVRLRARAMTARFPRREEKAGTADDFSRDKPGKKWIVAAPLPGRLSGTIVIHRGMTFAGSFRSPIHESS